MADQNNPWDTTPAADSAVQSADAREYTGDCTD